MSDRASPYLPDPLTQRDGSSLANSNCRPTSIAVGLAYQKLDADGTASSGSAMRSRMPDQSGGTDSSDAAAAWRSYGESLTIRDGYTFDNALQDLAKGHLVHLDVWAASMGGCLSGSGAYGHTVAVLPDCEGGKWLVCDPWCSPPKWQRIAESKLRAGAEEWGRRAYSEATGGRPGGPISALLLALAAKRLMDRFRPGGESDPRPDPGETGGGGAILFTRTRAIASEDDVPGLALTYPASFEGTVTMNVEGASAIVVATAKLVPLARGTIKPAYMRAHLDGPFLGWPAGTEVYVIGDDAAAVIAEQVIVTPAPGGGGDCSQAVEVRDAEWVDALTEFWPVGVSVSMKSEG